MTIVSLDGFALTDHFVVRECTVMESNGDYEHFRFAAPTNFQTSSNDRRIIQFTSMHLSKIPYFDQSLLPYETVFKILQKLSSKKLYCAGNQAHKFLREALPLTTIVDVSIKMGFKFPTVLNGANCGRRHNPRYCSLAKALCMKEFLEIPIM